MSGSKNKQKLREEMLAAQPRCIYCGRKSETVDHCPPRVFFRERHAPKGYEFPCCRRCNDEARLDEQALGALVHIRLLEDDGMVNGREFAGLIEGVNNNQPELVREWNAISRSDTVDALRKAFGRDGYRRFGSGWGAITLGPMTHSIVDRFMVKMGKALYYKHVGEILDGVVYARHIDRLNPSNDRAHFDEILRLAPEQPSPERNGKSLLDQFIYRFNYSPQMGAVYAVVQFTEQFIFQLIVMRRDMEARLAEMQGVEKLSASGRHECYLASGVTPEDSA